MSSVRVLFLAANPRSTRRLALDEEMHAIQQRLRESGAAERFELRSEWALRAEALPAAIMRHKPSIVHFSGHGTETGELLLVGSQSDQTTPVSPDTLQRLFKILGNGLFCVVLNACFSEAQANALAQIVPCAVGMSREVTDAGAIAFAAGFYEALAFDRSLQAAFELGCTAIELTQQSDQHLVPQLRLRRDVDAEKLRLSPTLAPPTPSAPPSATEPTVLSDTPSLLSSAQGRIRLIQEARFPWQHNLSLPQIEDLLTSNLRDLPATIGLHKNFFKQPHRIGLPSPLNGPIDNQRGGLLYSVTHSIGNGKLLHYGIELSQDGMLRLAEYIDNAELDGPSLNIKYVAERIALFVIFCIRFERRLPAHPPSFRRCKLHEIDGVTCTVGDWATMEIFPGMSAGLGIAYAPHNLSLAETTWMPIGGDNDGCSNVASLVGAVLRELFYKFGSRNTDRLGLVRPTGAQLQEVIKRIYEVFI